MGDLAGAVGGARVNNDDLDVLEGLGRDAMEQAANMALLIAATHND